jgi:hypothetical protein
MTAETRLYRELTPQALADVEVVVLAGPPRQAEVGLLDGLAELVAQGGRLVAFTTAAMPLEAYRQLAERGVLPGTPQDLRQAPLRLTDAIAGFSEEEAAVVGTLRNYSLGSIVFHGSHVVTPVEGARTLWAFDSGEPFVLVKTSGLGTGVLVNTSADDSLSTLFKAPAAVAFTAYLLGSAQALEQLAFEAGKPIYLRTPATSVLLPTGLKQTISGDAGLVHLAAQQTLGWVVTRPEPGLHAGINTPRGETDLAPPQAVSLELMLRRQFPVAEQAVLQARQEAERERAPLGPALAWAAVACMLLDVFLSNRLTRA